MDLPEIHQRQRLHDLVIAARNTKRDLYNVYALAGVAGFTTIVFYCLPIGAVGDIAMAALNCTGFFYIGRAYTNVRRRLNKANSEYNEAFGVNRVL